MKAIFDVQLTSKGYECHYEVQELSKDVNGNIDTKAHRKMLLAILHQVSCQLTKDEEVANTYNWTADEINKLEDVC